MRIHYVLICGLALFLLSACGSSKTDVMFECPSPSGMRIATFYRISTGDRPGDQTMQLNIRPVAATLDTGMHSFSFRHGYDAILHWDGEDRLQVEYPQGSEIRDQETAVFGTSQTFNASNIIHIAYIERMSTHGYFIVEQRCF